MWALVPVLALALLAPVPRADASAHVSGTVTAVGASHIAQGRYFQFKSTVTNTGSVVQKFDVLHELVSPSGTTEEFLLHTTAALLPGESSSIKRSVSSAKFFTEMGTFTIRAKVGEAVLAELVYTVGAPDFVVPTFVDVTEAAGVGSGDGPGAVACEISDGAAWADVDGDSDLDIFIPSQEPWDEPHHLWINDGTGTFTNEAAARGISDAVPGMGAAFADYDNDGDADLYRANNGPNQLYQNNGAGVFTEIGAAVGVADPGMTQSAAWGDFDADGRLDLYSINYSDCTDPGMGWPGNYEPDHLYHQLPDGTFEDVTAILPATPVEGAGFQASFLDFDDDGDADIYLANDYLKGQPEVPDHNRLFRNDGLQLDGSWKFTDVSNASGAGYAMNAMGTAIGDPDRDLDLDMVISNIGDEKHARNNGDGTFTSVEKSSKVGEPKGSLPDVACDGGCAPTTSKLDAKKNWTWGEVFADFNNDGWEDLYAAASHMMGHMEGVGWANRVRANNGDGTFLDVSALSMANDFGHSRGVAVADYDRDGKLDLLSVNEAVPPVLYRNATVGAGNWLQVDTIGMSSNRDGCGAKAILTSESGSQRRDVFCGSTSFGSGVDKTLHFGLGADTEVSSLTIFWPSGVVQAVPVSSANQLISVVEAG